jgi:hypothetical protein
MKHNARRLTRLYMLRAFGPPGFRFARSFHFAPFPRKPSPTFLPALVFAAQSPYPGCQNVIYSRTLGEIPAP